jgi:hypothetical protein
MRISLTKRGLVIIAENGAVIAVAIIVAVMQSQRSQLLCPSFRDGSEFTRPLEIVLNQNYSSQLARGPRRASFL